MILASFDFHILADVDATLNAIATVLIVAGLIAIKRGNESLHKKMMLSATAVSALFLVSYLTYHYTVGSVKYAGTGTIRTVYFVLLISHIILAAVQVPLILLTLRAAFRGDRAKHRRLARITAPIWLYVSVTGVIIYAMLWHW